MHRFLIAAASLAVLSAGAANAASSAKAPRYDDLDLSRARDAHTYSMRLDRAVEAACERENSGFGTGQEMFACRTNTRAAMTSSLPEEVRTAYAAGLSGQDAGRTNAASGAGAERRGS